MSRYVEVHRVGEYDGHSLNTHYYCVDNACPIATVKYFEQQKCQKYELYNRAIWLEERREQNDSLRAAGRPATVNIQ